MDGALKLVRRLPSEAAAGVAVARAAGFRPMTPVQVARIAFAAGRLRLGAAPTIGAVRYGDAVALVDELGALSFVDLDRRSNALADVWRQQGLGEGTGIGILCRNHRGFLDALHAGGKIGARVLLLNTDFAGPQAAEVCAREGVDLIVHDAEFTDVVAAVPASAGRVTAWTDDEGSTDTLEGLIASGDPQRAGWLTASGSVVLLTSGTTGTPKGANRGTPSSLATAGGLLSKIPFRARESTYVTPPMFHAWGLSNALIASGLGTTIVTARRFDPARVLATVAEQRCTALIVVPVMLKRLLDAEFSGDLSALRIIASSGSQLEGAVATAAMDRFGDVVYSMYGSTEVAIASIATPADLRAAPTSVGVPPRGITVRLLDDHGAPVPPGATGRIFVGNGAEFSGYTGGGGKEVVDGLMSSGDVGHFDGAGRLFVDGRDDEMIVSGGENVFPREVEELLATHPGVTEAAAVGVDDAEFGQRLRAYVVRCADDLDADAVRDFVRANLARYKVPRDVVFVDALPRNPAGKVLKRELQ